MIENEENYPDLLNDEIIEEEEKEDEAESGLNLELEENQNLLEAEAEEEVEENIEQAKHLTTKDIIALEEDSDAGELEGEENDEPPSLAEDNDNQFGEFDEEDLDGVDELSKIEEEKSEFELTSIQKFRVEDLKERDEGIKILEKEYFDAEIVDNLSEVEKEELESAEASIKEMENVQKEKALKRLRKVNASVPEEEEEKEKKIQKEMEQVKKKPVRDFVKDKKLVSSN